jgi:NodT family efflux transporter outer membrane factor (OMF) lipoprotein
MPLEIRRAGDTGGDGRAASLDACHIARKVTGLGTFELEARHDVPHTLRTLHDGHATPGRARHAARWLLCAVALTMLTGCLMVGPDFQSPPPPGIAGFLPNQRESVPGAAVIRGAQISARWWDVFRSRNLNRLIQDGIENNPDLQAAEAAVRAAQANAISLRGTLLPVISATFDASRQMTPTATLTSNVPSGADTYSLHTPQVTVAFVPDVFGGTRRAIESADALAEQQSFQREAVYVTLASNIALAAIQEASLRGQIAATRRLIEIQTQLLDILRRQNDRGQIALPDVVAQETAAAQARLLLPPLERQLAQQRNLLATLTGRFAGEGVPAAFELSSFRLPRTLPLSLPADLVRQRPDIRAAEANLHALNAQIGVAFANRLPQIKLTGNAGSSADAIARLFSPGTMFWTIAGNAAQTVFDAGSLFYKQKAAEEAAAQAAAQYRATVLVAFQNVADVLRALQADARTVSAALAAEESANRSIDLVRRQVEQGQVSSPVLLNAQQAYLQTSLARVQAQAARLADTVALHQALGGGWWNRAPSSEIAVQ